MGKSEHEGEELEIARYQVDDDQIVVHGAKIMCSCAGKSVKNNYLSVLDGHGMMESGNNCAHDMSCIPVTNINPFPCCVSPDAEKALSALAVSASSEIKKKYEAALKIIAENKKGNAKSPVPCTLPLLDRWFDEEEKEIVTDSMKMDTEIKQKMKALSDDLLSSIKKGADDLYDAYVISLYVDKELSPEEKVKKANQSSQLKDIRKKIIELCSDITKSLDTKIHITGNDFQDTVAQLREAKSNIIRIEANWGKANRIYGYLNNYTAYNEKLQTYKSEIDDMITKINGWKEKEYHLITIKSFLVCRCGGIISFIDSGQAFGRVVDRLEASILQIITEFKEHCQEGMVKYCSKEMDYVDFQWSSYKAAAKGLEEFEGMMLGSQDSGAPEEVCIYMELLCHSYNDEIKKTMMSILTLISMNSGVMTFMLAIYALATLEENVQGGMDGISADISALESVREADGKGGIVSKLGGGTIVKFNNLYTVVTSVVNFFYVSYDTWIETIRMTVFTDSHAHISERWLNRDGELLEKKLVHMYTKADYISGGMGRGLEWKEDPGVYVKQLIHKNDTTKDGKDISHENVEKTNQWIPFS